MKLCNLNFSNKQIKAFSEWELKIKQENTALNVLCVNFKYMSIVKTNRDVAC